MSFIPKGQRYMLDRLGSGRSLGDQWPIILILLAILVIVNFVAKSVYNIYFHPLKSVPGPWLAKLFDSYLTPARLRAQRAQALRGLHDQYGPVIRIAPNEISVSDWSAYREIYNDKNTTKTKEFYEANKLTGLHHNIFSMRNKQAHSARRKLQSPSYSQQATAQHEPLINERADVFLRRVSARAKESLTGKTADVFDLCGLFSLEVILKCAFNRSYGDSPAGDSLTLLKAMEAAPVAVQVMSAFPFITRGIGRRLPTFIGHSFRQHDLWESMTKEYIEDFRQHEAPSDTALKFMVSPMLFNTDSFLERQLDSVEIREEVMGLLFAGSGTTSTTIFYLLYSLARDHGLQEQLRSELHTVSGSLKDLQNLPLLNAVIKETMRLHPTIISTLPRVLDHELLVDKYLLPQGTIVGMQSYVHQRDSTVFPNPNEFNAQRWLASDAETKVMNMALTPFSLGQRNCLGQNLARAELFIATNKIVRKFKLKINPDMTAWDMEMQDRFAVIPNGRRLLLDVEEVN